MTTSYSPFFSSGLLAPSNDEHFHRARKDSDRSILSVTSIVLPSSTEEIGVDPLDDNSDIEREKTPTPGLSLQTQGRTLRKRRSSLSLSFSPRTPTSKATFQKHVHTPSRSRSGSVTGLPPSSTDNPEEVGTFEAKSLKGRLRSGSVGTALKPRRNVRRLPNNPLPPPTLPLPPLPPLPTTPRRVSSKSISVSSAAHFSMLHRTPTAHARGDDQRTPLQRRMTQNFQ